MNLPAMVAALMDRRLQRRDLIVYGFAVQQLSYCHPLPFKVLVVARGTALHVADVSRALRRLTSFGYLEAGPLDGRRRTYLLRGTIPALLVSAPTNQIAA